MELCPDTPPRLNSVSIRLLARRRYVIREPESVLSYYRTRVISWHYSLSLSLKLFDLLIATWYTQIYASASQRISDTRLFSSVFVCFINTRTRVQRRQLGSANGFPGLNYLMFSLYCRRFSLVLLFRPSPLRARVQNFPGLASCKIARRALN